MDSTSCRQLREVLCGAHVLIDEPELYERWRFPKSRERLSSHHKTVDKAEFPDIGLNGQNTGGFSLQYPRVRLRKRSGSPLHFPGDRRAFVQHLL